MKQTREQRLAKQKQWRDSNKAHIKSYSDNYRETNKDQVRATTKAWRSKVKDTPEYKAENRARVRQWQIDNPDKLKALRKRKLPLTPERKSRLDRNRIKSRSKPEVRAKINARNRKANREKTRTKTSSYYTDLHTRLASLLRGRIYRLLFRANARKSATTLRLLGCTYEFFVTYMESKFADGMSWENQGKNGWEIDHDTACYRFDLTKPEHQQAAFHFSNLKPCWYHINQRKDSLKDKPKLTDLEVTKMLESQAFLTRILPVPLPLAA